MNVKHRSNILFRSVTKSQRKKTCRVKQVLKKLHIVELDGERKVVQITKINPVPKDDMLQTYIPFSDQERKLSYQMIHDFLDGVSESC